MLVLLYHCLISTVIVHSSNILIDYIGFQGKWFQLHSFINFIVSGFSINDTIACLTDPNQAVLPASNSIAITLVIILHIYHIFAFKMRQEDWIHHLSGFIISPTLLLYNCKATSMCCFFISGFPGGVDYATLVLVKNNIVSKKRQKQISAHLNTYIRQPGGVIGSYLLSTNALISYENKLCIFFLSAVLFINASFYSAQAIYSYADHCNIIDKI